VNAANEVLLYDRYGRKKTEKVSSSTAWEWRIDWENRDGSVVTQLHIWDAKRVFPGRLFWLNIEDKYYLFDGNKVFDILNK
jgi:hypothetical protein